MTGNDSDPETLPSFSAAPGNDISATFFLHPAQKAVILVTPPVVGLKRTLHDSISLSGAVIVKFTCVQSGIIFYGSETVKVGQVSRLAGAKPGLWPDHDLMAKVQRSKDFLSCRIPRRVWFSGSS